MHPERHQAQRRGVELRDHLAVHLQPQFRPQLLQVHVLLASELENDRLALVERHGRAGDVEVLRLQTRLKLPVGRLL